MLPTNPVCWSSSITLSHPRYLVILPIAVCVPAPVRLRTSHAGRGLQMAISNERETEAARKAIDETLGANVINACFHASFSAPGLTGRCFIEFIVTPCLPVLPHATGFVMGCSRQGKRDARRHAAGVPHGYRCRQGRAYRALGHC